MLVRKMAILRASYWKYLAAAWLVCLGFWVFSLDHNFASFTVAHKTSLTLPKLLLVFTQFHSRHPILQPITTRLTAYDEIYGSISMFDFLKDHLLEDRCRIYFNHLTMSSPDWTVDPHEKVTFDRKVFKSFESFKKDALNEYEKLAKEADKENKDPPPKPTEESIRVNFENMWKKVRKDEQLLHDYLAHVRIFDKCYLASRDSRGRNDTRYVRKQQQFLRNLVDYIRSEDEPEGKGYVFKNKLECSGIEEKIFPWLTMEYPTFVRWDGKRSYFPGNDYRRHESRNCFLEDFKLRLNGKGIVMTISDSFLDEAIRLIRVLRFFKNKYPIQFIYHSNLSDDSKKAITKAARGKFKYLPQQEVWFVDIKTAVEERYLNKFNGFANKIAATLFNSFAEMMLLDADSVILQEPAYFFKLKKFVETGTMFYKDRAAFQHRQPDEVIIFQKLMPSLDDSVVFNIPQITNYTLNNEFFHRATHYMESGNVVINRKKHFIQPLMMSVMNFYSPIILRLYGDKELFWLSLVLQGDENYSFNENLAASIGEFTPSEERHKDINKMKSFRSKEICSNHPSHISDVDNLTLVWFNSGFRFCGNVNKGGWDSEKEFNQKKRYTKFETLEEFRTFFKSQMKITHAIIPPFDPNHKLAKNAENEPEAAWVMAHYCMGYTWCAYSLLGGFYKDENGVTQDNSIEGVIVEFTPEQIAHYEAVGEIWMAPTE